MARILSIVPYKFMKPKNGGHWGVFLVDEILSIHNEVYTLGVRENEPFESSFTPLNILRAGKSKYLPYAITGTIVAEARKVNADYIFCHHPYLVPAAKKAANQLGIPLYIRSHNIESERFRSMGKPWWRIFSWFEKNSYKKADKVFFLSDEDAAWGLQHYSIDPAKIAILPFPSSIKELSEVAQSKAEVAVVNQLNPNATWLVFMGDLKYGPNDDAVKHIIEEIYPRLEKQLKNFEILICGKGLSEAHQERINKLAPVKALGFVEDLNAILYHSQVMINPLILGAGVKTKVVESLAWNLYVVSTHNGAIGIKKEVCGDKLTVVPDKDWDAFADAVTAKALTPKTDIPDDFFDFYYTRNIADHVQQFFK